LRERLTACGLLTLLVAALLRNRPDLVNWVVWVRAAAVGVRQARQGRQTDLIQPPAAPAKGAPMSAPGGRAQATQARREQIVQATIDVLAERGYAGTTFDAICAHAGLSSKRLISYHFATKDDLLATVLTDAVADRILSGLDPARAAEELVSTFHLATRA
jgi:Bacterial regulatory proteins, tetR family